MIKECKTYLSKTDLLAIEKGIAKLDIHSIRINRREYTEEEREINSKNINTYSNEEWTKIVEESEKEIASKIKPILDILDENFIIYQYKKELSYRNEWDLFFNGGTENPSNIRLTLNTKKSVEERINDKNKLMEYISKFNIEDLDIIIQYTTTYNENQVNDIVKSFLETNKNKFFFYMGMEGKIKEIDDNSYGFFKKKSRSRYYEIKEKDILGLTFA